jgi:hypothetical protein
MKNKKKTMRMQDIKKLSKLDAKDREHRKGTYNEKRGKTVKG